MIGLANVGVSWAIETNDKMIGQLVAVERTYSLSVEDCARRWDRQGRLAPNDERKAGCVVILAKTNESSDDRILAGSFETSFSVLDPYIPGQSYDQEVSFKLLPYGYRISFQDKSAFGLVNERDLSDFSSVRPMIEAVYKRLKPSYKLKIQTVQPILPRSESK